MQWTILVLRLVPAAIQSESQRNVENNMMESKIASSASEHGVPGLAMRAKQPLTQQSLSLEIAAAWWWRSLPHPGQASPPHPASVMATVTSFGHCPQL